MPDFVDTSSAAVNAHDRQPAKMKSSQTIVSSLLCASTLASPSRVVVASYSGGVFVLEFDATDCELSKSQCGIQRLEPVAVTRECSTNPSWLTVDSARDAIYCMDEGLATVDGALTSLRSQPDGSLSLLDQKTILGGPVHGVIFGPGGRGLALAHYMESSITTWDISDPSRLVLLETDTFEIAAPGPNPVRQDKSHPHGAILDPTGRFLFFPDLAADLVRLYTFDDDTLALKALAPIPSKPGYGPRHLSFITKGDKTFAYLIMELANRIVGYDVTYPAEDRIELREIFDHNTHGDDAPIPNTVTAAELAVSPDENFIIVSARGEDSLTIPNFDPNDKTTIVSDPLINFSVDAETGFLTPIQTSAAGGRFPRHFSINKAGDLLAVGLQKDGRVTLIERDIETGRLGNFVAYANLEEGGNLEEGITCAMFDE